jgi:prophage tail gpP-like protein
MSTQKIIIQIDGQDFDGWNSVSVSRSIEDFCGSFSIKLSRSQDLEFPIKVGQGCVIKIEDQTVLTGFVEKIEIDYAVDKHDITISGRDRTVDVLDSTIIGLKDTIGSFTLQTLTENVLKKLNITNIKVINNVPSLKPIEQADANVEQGVPAFDYLEAYAKRQQVLLTTDGLGNIVFEQAGTEQLNTILNLNPEGQASILEAKATYDNSKRFHLYELTGQSNQGDYFSQTQQTPDQTVSIAAQATDNEIRSTRTYAYVPNDNSTHENIKGAVKWQANFRRAQSFIYNVTVQGFKPENDDEVWTPNKKITVQDTFVDRNGPLLISSIQYSYSLDEGSKTSLKIMEEDAFTTIVNKPDKKKKVTKDGGEYFKGITVEGIT